MKSPDSDIPEGVTEEAERLICRELDGEITLSEQARLDQILAESSAARVLLAEYRQMDAAAAQVMRGELAHLDARAAASGASAFRRERRSYPGWIAGAVGAAMSAAAVLVVSVLLRTQSPDQQVAIETGDRAASVNSVRDSAPVIPNATRPEVFVDYQQPEYRPVERYGRGYRDVIGVRGANPNVIYLFERGMRETKIVPVSGDF